MKSVVKNGKSALLFIQSHPLPQRHPHPFPPLPFKERGPGGKVKMHRPGGKVKMHRPGGKVKMYRPGGKVKMQQMRKGENAGANETG